MTARAQTTKHQCAERAIGARRHEAQERVHQWHADAKAAYDCGNEIWAAECAARALAWIETLNALDNITSANGGNYV